MARDRNEKGNPELRESQGEGAASGGRQAPPDASSHKPGSPEGEGGRATREPQSRREVAVSPDEPRGDEPGAVYPSTSREGQD